VRPCRSIGERDSTESADVVVIRDTLEDLYAGVEFDARSDGAVAVIDAAKQLGDFSIPAAAGISVKFVSESAARRIASFAFEYARRHGRRKIAVVHKATVMRSTDGLFASVVREVAATYPEIAFSELLVDDACARLVRKPRAFDVIVTTNLYGDILSDVAATLTGGIGLAAGANFGDSIALFEPAHGTAPSHVGRDDVNPAAAILSAAMMLEHIGFDEAARCVRTAVTDVVRRGEDVTYDLRFGSRGARFVTTTRMTDAVIGAFRT
jgi:isocitrate dehydrogenase (NAD+)